LSWYASAEEGAYANAKPAYPSYDLSYDQPYSYQDVSDEPSWFSNQSYEEVYEEQDSTYQVPTSHE
jgi:hypothetical protein